MAQSPREGQQAQKEAERPSEGNRQNSAAKGTWGRDSDPALRQTERLAEIGGERMQAAAMANHASTRTTQLYDRRRDEISLEEVERIVI